MNVWLIAIGTGLLAAALESSILRLVDKLALCCWRAWRRLVQPETMAVCEYPDQPCPHVFYDYRTGVFMDRCRLVLGHDGDHAPTMPDSPR